MSSDADIRPPATRFGPPGTHTRVARWCTGSRTSLRVFDARHVAPNELLPRAFWWRYGGSVADADHVDVELAGRTVRVTSPDKVMFPESGATKLDVVRYYESIAAPLMRAMGDRPVLMQRFPNGVGGSSFFQKRVPKD